MNARMTSLRTAVTGLAAGSLALGLGATIAPAAHAADLVSFATPTITNSVPNQGNAITSGARVFVGSIANQVTVGGAVVASVGPATYTAPADPLDWKATWFACSNAGQALDSCTIVSVKQGQGSLGAVSAPYIVKAEDLGKYLAFRADARYINGRLTMTHSQSSDRSKDLRVIPNSIPTSARPVIGVNNVVAGQNAGLLTGPWTLPSDHTFVSRTVSAWSCPSANAGQVASATWDTSGCTSLTVSNASSTSNVATISAISTSIATGGTYLVAQSNLVARSGNSPYLYTVRSATALLPRANLAGGNTPPQVNLNATLDPNAGAQVDPNGTLTDNTQAGNTGNADTTQATPEQINSGLGGEKPPVQPTMSIRAKKVVQRGGKLLVTVTLKGKGYGTIGTGPAKVELVKSQLANAKAVKQLRTIEIENLKGARYELIGKQIKKGNYFLRVVFTDAGSGVQSASLKKVTIR